MTPKEKAQELVNKFKLYSWESHIDGYVHKSVKESSKQCALIAVDEILNALQIDAGNWIKYNETKEYWKEVKNEIELL